MRKGEQSRARMVAATAELLQKQGYHATGLAEIVEKSAAPRGSLYFYFPGGKEELACEALRNAGTTWRQQLEAVINAAPDLPSSVMAACEALAQWLEASNYELGCPMATVALEASTTSEAVHQVCAQHFAGWQELIAHKLVAAGAAPEVAQEMALFSLSATEGALLLSKVQRSTQPLLTVGRTLAGLAAMTAPPAQA